LTIAGNGLTCPQIRYPDLFMKNSAVLLIDCPDRTGLVAAVSGLLYQHGANILHADQHQDPQAGLFFMRVEWALDGFDLERFRAAFQPIAAGLAMRWRIETMTRPMRVAVFVSRYLHCLVDLLHRQQIGELPCSIPLIVGNHPDAEPLARFHNVEFRYVPVRAEGKSAAEAEQFRLLDECGAELIVLARYMQILSPAFVARYPNRIINVHHSFLPAFVGARPYHAAFERGVKLIGATSHYVTEELDEGPIIEQDVTRISHRDDVDELIAKGRDLERVALSRAIKWHLEHRVLCYGKKTVVFD
jgi:formyltetrahydrofolate deformylase